MTVCTVLLLCGNDFSRGKKSLLLFLMGCMMGIKII